MASVRRAYCVHGCSDNYAFFTEGKAAMRQCFIILLGTACICACLLSCAGRQSATKAPTASTCSAAFDPLPAPGHEKGFKSIFDGKTLNGWKGADMSFWTVEDGAITGKITTEHPTERNHYLVYQGGKLGDFELKLRHRVLSKDNVNCGFQFRSEIFDGKIPDDCRGYQMDNNTGTPWLVRLYDEHGRETLAWRGEKAVFDASGQRTVTPIEGATGEARFRLEDWHEYHLICRGSDISLRVNGRLVSEAIDGDPSQRDLSGILALQLHSGPPMTVQFKDIRLKMLATEK